MSKPVTLAINGFGRIGRCFLRAVSNTDAWKKGQIRVAAINDLTDPKTIHHLFRYDSVHGPFRGETSLNGNSMTVNGQTAEILKSTSISP